MTNLISSENMRLIVARASSIRERLDGRFQAEQGSTDAEQVDERIVAWRRIAAVNDEALFARRLAWDNWDVDSLRSALGVVHLRDGEPLPGWAETLAAVMETAAGDASFRPSPIVGAPPVPFEQLYGPFLTVAQQSWHSRLAALGDRGHAARELFSKGATQSLLRMLLSRLSGIGVDTLELEFDAFRGATPQPGCYEAFVAQHLNDGFQSLFTEYSVLGRLLAVAVDLWVESTIELCLRLKDDWAAIQSTFQPEGAAPDPDEAGRLAAIDPSLSDPHRGGRSVAAITFASGLRLIYKPKEMALEIGYGHFVDWLNARGAPLPLKAPRALDRGTYGWVERIEHLPCDDEMAVSRFYRRAGMLLCLLHVLEGTDCHSENLIAHGEQPVLIDMETLLHHQAKHIVDLSVFSPAHVEALEIVDSSVLRIGMLPFFQLVGKGKASIDISALGDIGDDDMKVRKVVWSNLNHDLMAKSYEEISRNPHTNRVILRGEVVSPFAHVDEIVSGFQEMAHFLMNERDAVLAADGPLAALRGTQVRFIFRSTKIYWTVQQHSLRSERLRDGADRSIFLDVLSRAFTLNDERPPIWPLLESELNAMEQLDVPFFTARTNSDAIEISPGVVVPHYFKAPSDDIVTQRVRGLSEAYLEQQVPVVRSTMNAARANASEPAVSEHLGADRATLSRGDLVAHALRVARALERTAIRTAGTATWVAQNLVPGTASRSLRPISEALYDGASGVALFLGALERVTGGTEYRSLLNDVLLHLKRQIISPEFMHTATSLGIGGASGLGSVVYALSTLSSLLGDSMPLELARHAALQITPARIEKDAALDIIGGSAGAILGLLSLFKASGDKATLDTAILCGEQLLRSRVESEAGPRAWPTIDGALIAGASHGAAGIAFALARLAAVSGEKAFQEAALEGIHYERAIFSNDERNWPYLGVAEGEGPLYMNKWCHGAAGIGLMRVAGLPVLDTPDIREDIEMALATTRSAGFSKLDQICCGNLGRTDLLVSAGRALNRPDLLEEASAHAAWILHRANKVSRLALIGDSALEDYSPSLFQGHAGVGYEFLRIAEPDIVPSILMFDA